MSKDSRSPHDKLLQNFRDVPLFHGLPDDALLVIFVASEERIFRAGEVVVKEGAEGEELFLIGRGAVDVVINFGSTKQTTVGKLGTKDFFGEMCVIEPTSRSATVFATETTFIYSIKSSTLNKLYQIWPEHQTTIMSNLSRGLAERVIKGDPEYELTAY
ncbi:MAG: cyclic nucleotide-binding domain-containing protein [Verrucomicrobiota bacterium]